MNSSGKIFNGGWTDRPEYTSIRLSLVDTTRIARPSMLRAADQTVALLLKKQKARNIDNGSDSLANFQHHGMFPDAKLTVGPRWSRKYSALPRW